LHLRLIVVAALFLTVLTPLTPKANASSTTFPIQHYASLVPQPPNMPTNSCYRRSIGSTNYYQCRYVSTVNKNFSTSLAKDVSAYDTTYGRQVTTAYNVYEGCRYAGSDFHCDYLTTNRWDKRTSSSSTSYYLNAMKQTQKPVSCALELSKFWKGTMDWNSLQAKCGAIQY
jgi:hypothetical protein